MEKAVRKRKLEVKAEGMGLALARLSDGEMEVTRVQWGAIYKGWIGYLMIRKINKI